MLLQLSVTPEEHAAIKARAEEAQLPFAGYIIAAAVNPEKFPAKCGAVQKGQPT